MQKDASYHRNAIQYNEELADFAEELADRLDHPEIQRWSRAVSKQHRFHLGRHKNALAKLEQADSDGVEDTEDGGEDSNVSIAQQQAEFAASQQTVHRSAVTGEFVSEENAEANPTTTVEERIDHNSLSTETGPDPTQAAEPVHNQGQEN